MKTRNKLRRIAMLISLVMLIVSGVGTTYGYVVIQTDPITNVFVVDHDTTDPDPLTVTVHVEKIVKNIGDAKCGRSGFRFILKQAETSKQWEATSNNSGKASFVLTFTKADIGKTYTYQLYEIDHGMEGMTYDTDVHRIAVTVSQNDQKELVAELTMDGKSVDILTATFENTYNAKIPSLPATGDESHLMGWFALMIVSSSAFVALLVYDRKSRRA